MTLTSTLTKVQYAGDNSTTVFPVTFVFYANSGIRVILSNDSTGVETVQTETTHYTLTGGNGAVGSLTMLTAPPSGNTLTIKSNIDDTQETSLPFGGQLDTEALERRLDIITRLIQQQAEELTRAVVLSESSSFSSITIPNPSAGKALLWNATADALENSTNDFNDIVTDATTQATAAAASATAAAASAAAASTSETNAATSATNAATSATNAATEVTYAAEWANKAEDSLISVAAGGDNVDDYSALHWANKASASATAAAASAANPDIWTVNQQSNTNYTVVLTDKYKVIEMTTGASTRTVTLPAAATATDGFAIVIKKVDSGAGEVTIDADGSETIDGELTQTLSNQYDFMRIVSDGTDWSITSTTGGSLVSFITQETPSGTINGVNATFTLANTPQTATEMVYLDNVRLQRTEDYTISGATITMIQIPQTGEVLKVDYFKSSTLLNSVDLSAPPAIGDSTPNTIDGTVITATSGFVGPNFSGKNKFINGSFEFWQRGNSFTSVTSEFTADKWQYIRVAGANVVDISEDTTVTPNGLGQSYKIDVTTADASVAAGDLTVLRHSIEGNNLHDMLLGKAGAKQMTLSFWVRSPKTGTHYVRFANSAFDRSYPAAYTVSVADTWEKKTITLTGDTTGTWLYDNSAGLVVDFVLLAGTTFHGTADSWQAGNIAAATGVVNVMDNTANNFYLADVQLEIGANATEFERRLWSTEFDLCRRYFRVINNGNGDLVSSTQCLLDAPHPGMRAAPSYSATAALKILSVGTTYTQSSASVTVNGTADANGARLSLINFTGMTAGNSNVFMNEGGFIEVASEI